MEILEYEGEHYISNDFSEKMKMTFKTYEGNSYVVKPLDTWQGVAKKLGKSVEQLRSKNNCSEIFIGQKLKY